MLVVAVVVVVVVVGVGVGVIVAAAAATADGPQYHGGLRSRSRSNSSTPKRILTLSNSDKETVLLQVNITHLGIPNTFYVPDNHWEWCQKMESEQVAALARELLPKKNDCVVLDVGMNDGFYTQMSASLGCKVYAFEIQRKCIHKATDATNCNSFNHLINIVQAPVATINGQRMNVSFTGHHVCDGGFTVQSEFLEKVSHERKKPTIHQTFHTVSLDAFVPNGLHIDFLKIDVEGYEPDVLKGAENLFRERRIVSGVVEMPMDGIAVAWARNDNQPNTEPRNHPFFAIYERILSYGYAFTPMNCLGNTLTSPVNGQEHHGRRFDKTSPPNELRDYMLLPGYRKCRDLFIMRT
jgi:FkbM family methyltransferase